LGEKHDRALSGKKEKVQMIQLADVGGSTVAKSEREKNGGHIGGTEKKQSKLKSRRKDACDSTAGEKTCRGVFFSERLKGGGESSANCKSKGNRLIGGKNFQTTRTLKAKETRS